MRISYDGEVDALYIRLLEGEYQCRTLRLTDEVSLNIGPGEELVGIEVLDAKDVLGRVPFRPSSWITCSPSRAELNQNRGNPYCHQQDRNPADGDQRPPARKRV